MTIDLPEDPVLLLGPQTEALLRAHAETVARFGLGVAPTFKQELNRVIARQDADPDRETDRPVEPVTGAGQTAL